MKSNLYFSILLICFLNFKVAAQSDITISGTVKEQVSQTPIVYANVILKTKSDDTFIAGTATNEDGLFTIKNVASGNYYLEISSIGYVTYKEPVFIGTLSKFLNLNTIFITEDTNTLDEVIVTTKKKEISDNMDKKTYSLNDNINQSGGSVLQAMQNLPSVSVQDGKVKLRGNDKIIVLIDG